jgi:stage III sporulation protein AF
MEFMRSWIVNIIGVVTMCSFTEILMPDGNLRKYSQLIVGIIMMILIMKPMYQFMNIENLFDKITINSQSRIDKESIVRQSSIIKDKQTQQIIEGMEKRLVIDIANRISKTNANISSEISLDIDENIKSSGFGSIRKINIIIKKDKKDVVNGDVKPVKAVSLSEGRDYGKLSRANKENNIELEAVKNRIVEVLNEVYNVPRENINIYIQM